MAKFDLDKIKASVNIVDVIGNALPLKKQGKEHVTCCPFHGEKTPSFAVNETKQFYHCFGCGVNGDVIDFVRDFYNLDFADACKMLGGEEVDYEESERPVPRERRDTTYDGYEPIIPVPDSVKPLVAGKRTPPVLNPSRVDEPNYKAKPWKPVLVHPYHTQDGKLYGYVLRLKFNDRKITPAVMWCKRPDGSEGWTLFPFPNPRPMYNLHLMHEHVERQIILVEGEKAADFVTKHGGDKVIGTCWAGGTNNTGTTDFSPLNMRSVVVSADFDEPGMKAMNNVISQFNARTLKLSWHPDGAEKGFDIADVPVENPKELFAYLKQNIIPGNVYEDAVEQPPMPPAPPPEAYQDGSWSEDEEQPDIPSQVVSDRDWKDAMLYKDDGTLRSTSIQNAQVMLAMHPDMLDVVGYNQFTKTVDILDRPPWESEAAQYPRRLHDVDDTRASAWLELHGINISISNTHSAIVSAAHHHPFNPLQDYLRRIEWDGVQRLDLALRQFFGVEEDEYSKAVSRRFLIGAVARALKPGCKMDTMLILEGEQGLKKSTAVAALFGEDWFTDELANLGSKDAGLQVQGVWCVEIAELATLSRAEANQIKEWITRQADRFRPPYGRNVIEAPRQCVLVGTVNPEGGYLKDATGGRRFWPVKCQKINVEKIVRWRDQIWAEAVHAFESGEKWWFDRNERELAEKEQSARYESDPWADEVLRFVHMDDVTTVSRILDGCLEIPKSQQNQLTQNRVAKILVSTGWERKQRRVEGERSWVYVRSKKK